MRVLALVVALVPAAATASSPVPAIDSSGLVRQADVADFAALPGEAPGVAARRLALDRAASLGLAGAELGQPRVIPTRLGTVVRFPTTVQGLSVLGAEVVVDLDRTGRVRRVASSATPIARTALERRLTGEEAMARAARGVVGALWVGNRPAGGFREVAWVHQGTARLAYEVHVRTLDLTRNLTFLVDAGTGEILRSTNRVFRSDAAKVYDPNPGANADSPLVSVNLTHLAAARDPDGYLVGELFAAFNCCAHEGCNSANPAKTISGQINLGIGGITSFQADVCDVQHKASNVRDRLTSAARTDYDYSSPLPTSLEPPPTTLAVGEAPADSDEFSEVHAFHHVGVAYDFFRRLSDNPAFTLRDPQILVWANFLSPDLANLTIDPVTGDALVQGLSRVDNAMFVPKEQWERVIPLPGIPAGTFPDVDTLVLFQGFAADFAYDGDVVYHEFTHGVVFATANLEGLHVDSYAALDQGMTMHEGLADYFSGALTNDRYMANYAGPRVQVAPGEPAPENALRDLENPMTCPDSLWGEPHQDSQHFSAAIWAGRKKLANDQAKRDLFDAAVFHALVTLVPDSTFEEAELAIEGAVAAAFPGVATAGADVRAEFVSRGAIDCVKVLDYTEPRAVYILGGVTAGRASPFVPGPVQLKVTAPQGAVSLTVTASVPSGLFGPQTVSAVALASVGQRITFSGSDPVAHDAQAQKTLTARGGSARALIPLTAQPGDDIYVTIINRGQESLALSDVALAIEVPPPDAGTVEPDAGPPEEIPDAGTSTSPASKCGCSASASPAWLAAALGLLGLRLRRSRRPAPPR